MHKINFIVWSQQLGAMSGMVKRLERAWDHTVDPNLYIFSVLFCASNSDRPQRSSSSLFQKPRIFWYRYLKNHEKPVHAKHTILLSLAFSTIWYAFHLSLAPLDKFVGAAKSWILQKKVGFSELLSLKILC
jgi:hypothetical protein